MGHPTRLARLSFATRDEPIPATSSSISDAVAALPKIRRDPMVDHVPEHMGSSTMFNQPERVPTELEIVPSLVDAVGPVAFDVDPAFHVGDELVNRGRAWLKPDVGDADDRDTAPSISAVGPT
jgi:hypothetical protein